MVGIRGVRGGGAIGGCGGWGGGGGGFLVVVMQCAPADRDASQLYYSYLIFSIGGMGVWGASGDLEGGLIIPNH